LRDFPQTSWNSELSVDAEQIVARGLAEDLGTRGDITGAAVIPAGATGRAALVSRASGVVAGLELVTLTLRALRGMQRQWSLLGGGVTWMASSTDGERVERGTRLGTLQGDARAIVAAERTILNSVGHLSGIATQASRYVEAIGPYAARIYDTRKTLPGWRSLEKYAVRCGGGRNHRLGLHAAIMIKDNHLALARSLPAEAATTPAGAVQAALRYLRCEFPAADDRPLVEIELDQLEPLAEVLRAGPDLVLLDNMSLESLRQAVAIRDQINRAIELEASGGVDLDSVQAIASTGVDRISVGALTHSAPQLDVALDWE
jgi:nicotinate-nucleotide pyrophosphorylase (carboxylating)